MVTSSQSIEAAHSPSGSSITGVEVLGSQDVNSPAGIAYVRVFGHVSGRVAAGEKIAGLDGSTAYSSEFELIRPATVESDLVLVEAENRGNPALFAHINGLPLPVTANRPSQVKYPTNFRSRFFLDGRRSYARVSWQTGIAGGVLATAQGIGEVIIRDFARLLSGEHGDELSKPLGIGRYRNRLLIGISQSAWFVNTFIAEGFNESPRQPGRPLFQAALAVNGTGNWLAINQLAGSEPQRPYVLPNGRPLAPSQILKRSRSDPFLIDIATYTDFYRLRASVSAQEGFPATMRRYDWPCAHSPAGLISDSAVFGMRGCNKGQVVPLNPLVSRPYLRTVIIGLERELEENHNEFDSLCGRYLPASTTFELGPAPTSKPYFNGLPGVEVLVPRMDADVQPIGGVRFPEVDYPLGRLDPPALTPCDTSSIDSTCGNVGGYTPFSNEEVARRYGSVDEYLAAYTRSLDLLIERGFLLAGERASMLERARSAYLDAGGLRNR